MKEQLESYDAAVSQCPGADLCRLRRSISVLIAEDERLIREVLELAVQYSFACARTRSVSDGRQALELLESGFPCDLLLCDLMMPEMDGARLVRRLAGHPDLKELPVIILSAVDEKKGHEIMDLPNVRAHFTKPIDPLVVADYVYQLLKTKLKLPECPTRKGGGSSHASRTSTNRN